MKVLLVGHACTPNRGSEPGLTWQFAWHLSRLHEVWVMANAGSKESVEQQLALTPNRQLHFIWIQNSRFFARWPVAYRELTLRLRYLFWQRAVLREARRQHHRHQFDLVHHLSWGTISAPPLLWRLPIPLVWGPVGGAQTTPRAYLRFLGPAWPLEFMRTLRVTLVTRMPGLRRAIRNCALVLSTNPETTRALQAAGAREVRFLSNCGVTSELLLPAAPKTAAKQQELIILWAGRLIPIKGLSLALEAFSHIEPDSGVRLRIVGDGPVKEDMQRLANALGVGERVDFFGAVPWVEMKRHYHDAAIFLFTSLRDSAGTVLAEAMASGLPIVTLNHQGAGTIVPSEAGIKVNVKSPDETVRALTEALRCLIKSPELRERMSHAAMAQARSMSWTRQTEIMSQWYEQVLAHRQQNDEYAYAAV